MAQRTHIFFHVDIEVLVVESLDLEDQLGNGCSSSRVLAWCLALFFLLYVHGIWHDVETTPVVCREQGTQKFAKSLQAERKQGFKLTSSCG